MDDRDEDDPRAVIYTSTLDALVVSSLAAYGDLWRHLHDTSQACTTPQERATLDGLTDDVALAFAQLAIRAGRSRLSGHW